MYGDERATAKPKYDEPNVICSTKMLNDAFKVLLNGCPVQGCGKPITSQSEIRIDACCAKATFTCPKGHPFSWTSSEQFGRQSLVFNRLVPASAAMTGLKIAPMRRFLGLLGIDSQDPDYMKSSSINLLVSLSNTMYEEEVAIVQAEMLEENKFSIGMFVFPKFCSHSSYG